MAEIERIDFLITKGEDVLKTHRPNAPGVIGFPTLNREKFSAWQVQTVAYLEDGFKDNPYTEKFHSNVKNAYKSNVEAGLGILKSLRDDLNAGFIKNADKIMKIEPIKIIEDIINKFHQVVRQLRSRHGDRPTLSIQDEYDVQDLLHALLYLHFEDVRAEECTPSYAGKNSRMDFLLKNEQIVIEVKKTRAGLTAKEVGTQLIEDIARYQCHQDCKTLICFVYDPEGYVHNPKGIENDLSQSSNIQTIVFIRP